MKKAKIFAVLMVVPFLTACGGESKTLTCTTEEDFTSQKVVYTIRGTKVTSVDLEVKFDFSNIDDFSLYANCNDAKECSEVAAKGAMEQCEKETDFENCKSKVLDTSSTVYATMKKESLKVADENKYESTDDLIEALTAENEGMTCKVS